MCGIAGIARRSSAGISANSLGVMAAAIKHRGPDGHGFYVGQTVGLAHVRLSIIDVSGGSQPLTNEDGQIVITYNGEVYNHLELRRELEQRGHIFKTRSDTEVLVHAYEEWGVGLLHRLNGQFAFAIYDRTRETLFVARDRFGVRPLFYAQRNGDLYFASEVKALFATGEIDAAVDRRGLDEVLTFWAARPPRTAFNGIASLEPGTYGLWKNGALWLHRYYELDYPEAVEEPSNAVETLDEIMLRGVGMRMRADVPVGAYLSGGLDSSITATLGAAASPYPLRSFSISFSDPVFDESAYQREVANAINTIHSVAKIGPEDIAASFPEVVWHAETPLVRTAPVPMFQLAKLTRQNGIKVVLTGEGADELFLGYDLFKEVSVRHFCARRPDSAARPRLFDRLYPYLTQSLRGNEFWRRSFLEAGSPTDPLFSHMPRFLLGARVRQFYTKDFRESLGKTDVIAELRASLPTRFFGWSYLNQAAYLEMTTLLSPYLLSSQGDRMAMAFGVEGRYPFLDHQLYEFAAALPTGSRLRGFREKEILRRWAARIMPAGVKPRGKQPYRAPDAPSFFTPGAPKWVEDHLNPDALRKSGIFDPKSVEGLVRRCKSGLATGFRENQAIVGILSTQLWHHQFFEKPHTIRPLSLSDASTVLGETAPATLGIHP